MPEPAVETVEQIQTVPPCKVILFNDDGHPFDAVVRQVQKATGCSGMDAYQITLTAHVEGKALAFTGPFERCEIVAACLQEIRLSVMIERD